MSWFPSFAQTLIQSLVSNSSAGLFPQITGAKQLFRSSDAGDSIVAIPQGNANNFLTLNLSLQPVWSSTLSPALLTPAQNGQVLTMVGGIWQGVDPGGALLSAPSNPGDNGKIARATGGNLAYVGGSAAGQVLKWSGTQWEAGQVDLADTDAITGKLPFANLADGTTAGNVLSWNGSVWAGAAAPGTAGQYFGDGADGDVTVSSGTTTLTRDMYYNNLTISGTGAIDPAGWRIFVKGTLDLTAAPANAIRRNGNNASGVTAGATLMSGSTTTVDNGSAAHVSSTHGAGVNGGTSGNGNGLNKTLTAQAPINGGRGGAGGNGGTSAGGTVATITALPFRAASAALFLAPQLGATDFDVGYPGAGVGGAGGGGGTNQTGGGGGGGGANIYIAAKTIARGGSTTAGCISANGGAGGSGTNDVGTNGPGGGGGGGGGWIYILCQSLSGSAATNAVRASGGNGGNAGNGATTGGDGGAGGSGGRITLINLGADTCVETVGSAGAAGNANTGGTGGTGGAGATTQINL